MDNLSHWGLIIAPGKETNWDNSEMSFLSSVKQGYVVSTHNTHFMLKYKTFLNMYSRTSITRTPMVRYSLIRTRFLVPTKFFR